MSQLNTLVRGLHDLGLGPAAWFGALDASGWKHSATLNAGAMTVHPAGGIGLIAVPDREPIRMLGSHATAAGDPDRFPAANEQVGHDR